MEGSNVSEPCLFGMETEYALVNRHARGSAMPRDYAAQRLMDGVVRRHEQ